MISQVPEQPVVTVRQFIEPTALLAILWRRKLLIVLGTIIGIAGGYTAARLSTEQYESNGVLLIMQTMPKFVDSAAGNLDAKNFDNLFATHIRLLHSPRIIAEAVDQSDLANLPGIVDQLDRSENAIDYINENLSVRRSGEGDSKGAFVIRVGFKHPVADECPIVVSAMMQAYQEYLKTSILNGQGHAVKLLEDLQGKIADDVEQKSKVYRDYLMTAPGIWNRQTLENSHQRRVDELETALTESELNKVRVESRLAIINNTLTDENRDKFSDLDRLAMIDDLHVARLELLTNIKGDALTEFLQFQYPERQELATAEYKEMLQLVREAETLRYHLGKNHPKVRESGIDIETLKNALKDRGRDLPQTNESVQPKDLVNAYKVLLEHDLTDIERHVAYIKGELIEEEKAAKELLDVSIESERLQDEYQRSSEFYTLMLQKLREQSLVNEFGEYSTEVLAEPGNAEMVWPRSKVMTAVGFVFGIVFGIMMAIAFDLFMMFRQTSRPTTAKALPQSIQR